ncbi:MAG: hypothetical protein ACYCWW_00650 [Deltaproteobacteria bacterium]
MTACRSASLAALLALGGCCVSPICLNAGSLFAFSGGPRFGSFPPDARSAVVLFHVSWAFLDTGHTLCGQPVSWPDESEVGFFNTIPTPLFSGTAGPIEHPAALYAAFREGLRASGVNLVDDSAVRSLPNLVALVPALREPNPSSPAPAPDARSFPFPLEVGDEPRFEQSSSGRGSDHGPGRPVPRRVERPRDLLDRELAAVSPRMPKLAVELGADDLIEVLLVPIMQIRRKDDRFNSFENGIDAPTHIFALVTIFDREGRRRYENVFESERTSTGDTAAMTYDDAVQWRAAELARKLGARVALEAFSR